MRLKIVKSLEKCGFIAALVVVLLARLHALPAFAGPYLDYANSLNARPPAGTMYRPDLEAELDALANAYRREEGKEAIAADSMFRDLARAHAADMMLHNFMGHRASTGHDLSARVSAYMGDVTRFPSLGENAARDTQKTPVDKKKARALFAQWVKSSPHRRNLFNRSFQFVSTGVIQRGNSIWAVQIFYAQPRAKGLFQ